MRDTLNPDSVLRNHSLYADKLGFEGFSGRVTGAEYPRNLDSNEDVTQFIDITFDGLKDFLNLEIGGVSSLALGSHDDFYNGLTLTFTSGEARGIATRVVRYFDANPKKFRLMILPDMNDRGTTPKST